MAKRYFVGLLGCVLALSAAPTACGGTDDGGGVTGPGDGGITGKGGNGKGANGNGGSANGGSGGLLIDASGQGDGALTDANTCTSTSQKAELLPLDLYVMLDRSGSMGQGSGKWEAVVSALNAFVGDSQSSGIGIGLDFFPDEPECNVGTYSTPSVPISVLPGNASAITNSLSSTGPSGGTPTTPAMQGALTYSQTYAIQNPNHVVVIVLATDGQPNDCFSDVGGVSAVAQTGATGTPKILTFVIGVGSQLSNLNAIAAAGGTNQAFIVDTTGNITQQFIDALNAIRGAALACEYLIPSPDGGAIDYGKVNVQYTPGSGGSPETLPNYKDAASCPASGDGWYYDIDPAVGTPTKILLCPGTCDKVKADTNGQVDVVFGCKTVIPGAQ